MIFMVGIRILTKQNGEKNHHVYMRTRVKIKNVTRTRIKKDDRWMIGEKKKI